MRYATADKNNKQIYNCGAKIACQFCSDSIKHNSNFPINATYGCTRQEKYKIPSGVA